AGQEQHEARAEDATRELCCDVGANLTPTNPAYGGHGERDRRVQVGTRDRREDEGHGRERETERERDARVAEPGAADGSRAATGEDDRERPDSLCNVTPHRACLRTKSPRPTLRPPGIGLPAANVPSRCSENDRVR